MSDYLNLNEKELLKLLVRRNPSERWTLDDIRERSGDKVKDKKLEEMIRNLGKKLGEINVDLNTSHKEGTFWVEYSDLNKAGIYDIIKDKRSRPVTTLYLAPGRGGLGTYLFDPRVAEGLGIFLNHNKAYLTKPQDTDDSLINSLDAVFMLGGIMPEIPSKPNSKSAREKLALTDRLDTEDMSAERIKVEKEYMDILSDNSLGIPETMAHRYKDELYGKIASLEDATKRSSRELSMMLPGFKGKVYYQPGEEDASNREHIRTIMADEIRTSRQELKNARKKVYSLVSKIEDSETRRVLALHTFDVLEKAESYVLNDDTLKAFDLTSEGMESDPREKKNRQVFLELLKEFIDKKKDNLINGRIEWNDEYFKRLDKEKIEEVKQDYSKNLGSIILSNLEILRTYYGLGWKMQTNMARATKMEGDIGFAEGRLPHARAEEDGIQKALYALGWLGDKDFAKANAIDVGIIKFAVDEKMDALYRECSGDLDLNVLNEGISDVKVGGATYRLDYYASSSNPGTVLANKMMKELCDLGSRHDFIPDVRITGPSTGLGIHSEKKYPTNNADAPQPKYEPPVGSTLLIQMGNMHTKEGLEKLLSGMSEKARPSGFPDEAVQGQVLLHTLGVDGESRFHVIGVEDLKMLSYVKEGIDLLKPSMEKKGADAKKIKEKIAEMELAYVHDPSISIFPLDDIHKGGSDPPSLNSGDMFVDAEIRYAREKFGYPDIFKTSEYIDGSQRFGNRELMARHDVFTKKQLETIYEQIGKDKNITLPEKEILYKEIGRMMAEGMHRPTVDEQYEEFLHGPVGDFIRETIENNGRIIAVQGDHEGRTSASKGDEPIKLRTGYVQCFVDIDGKKVRASDRIYVGGDTSDITGHLIFELPDGRKLYANHKMGTDRYSHLAKTGLDAFLTLTAHRHKGEILVKGGKFIAMPYGQVPPYPHVLEKGLRRGENGLMWVEVPDITKNRVYQSSASFYIAPSETIEKDPEMTRRRDIRKRLMEYIPPA